MNDKAIAIKAACGVAMKRWPISEDGSTFCNLATHHIATAAGFIGFKGMVANEIVNYMKKSPDFAKVTAEVAQALANDGRLVIAGRIDDPHGHVACVLPGGELVNSGKWHEEVPTLANIGKNNGIMGANWAFGLPPTYFTWIESSDA